MSQKTDPLLYYMAAEGQKIPTTIEEFGKEYAQSKHVFHAAQTLDHQARTHYRILLRAKWSTRPGTLSAAALVVIDGLTNSDVQSPGDPRTANRHENRGYGDEPSGSPIFCLP